MDSKYSQLSSSPSHLINISSNESKPKSKKKILPLAGSGKILHIPIIIVLSLLILLNIGITLYDYITYQEKDKNCSQPFIFSRITEMIYLIMTDIVIISIINIKQIFKRINYTILFLIISRIFYSSIIFGLNYNNIISCDIYKDIITKVLYIDFGYMFIMNLIYVIFIIIN